MKKDLVPMVIFAAGSVKESSSMSHYKDGEWKIYIDEEEDPRIYAELAEKIESNFDIIQVPNTATIHDFVVAVAEAFESGIVEIPRSVNCNGRLYYEVDFEFDQYRTCHDCGLWMLNSYGESFRPDLNGNSWEMLKYAFITDINRDTWFIYKNDQFKKKSLAASVNMCISIVDYIMRDRLDIKPLCNYIVNEIYKTTESVFVDDILPVKLTYGLDADGPYIQILRHKVRFDNVDDLIKNSTSLEALLITYAGICKRRYI